MEDRKMVKIVIDGGPCSGKSSALSRLITFSSSLGCAVISVPEAATELIINGATPESYYSAREFQGILVQRQLINEVFFQNAVERMGNRYDISINLMLLDRALMTSIAYVGEKMFREILSANYIDLDEEFMRRYDQVIYLRTAPEKYYTTENNDARTETWPEACEIDEKTLEAWKGRKHIHIIGNDYGGFPEKINAVEEVLARILGVPEPLVIERKYSLKEFVPNVQGAIVVHILQHYLKGGSSRVRAWTRDGTTTYFYTQKSNVPEPERTEHERVISYAEYRSLLTNADSECAPVEKYRQNFIWNNQYFRLDRLVETSEQILEVQPTTLQQEESFPDFLPVDQEVTSDPYYYNYNIAKRLA